MENRENLHQHHIEISSHTHFLKKEIDFLLKILKNCYSTSMDMERTKLLDSYWKRFEKSINDLDGVLSRIHKEEKSMAIHYKDLTMDADTLHLKEEQLTTKFNDIATEVKLLKESFYEFMHGCNACALKTH
ncbi:MAG: hypothetical protein JWO58_2943 [Chitinophagaceae bacterium]|nr:hypothetical protein [Chitinophagaceae bacterium]